MMHLRTSAIAAGLLALCLPSNAAPELASVHALFKLEDNQVDYAEAKLTVDHVIDPSIDTDSTRKELDRWVRVVRDNTPDGSTPRQKLDALLKTLYVAGPWNQFKPFAYDLTDPMGRNEKNKQLATYLKSRKGNCVSMPVFVAILSQRLGLPVALATAPSHVFVKFGDSEHHVWLNVEATAGGLKYDESYIKETGISKKALENELYLRPLSPHEGVGVIASTLMEHFGNTHESNALLQITEWALEANPKDPVALVWRASAYYLQLEERYISKYPNATDLPTEAREDYRKLSQENIQWFAKAEALGWTQETAEDENKYLQSIKKEKTRVR